MRNYWQCIRNALLRALIGRMGVVANVQVEGQVTLPGPSLVWQSTFMAPARPKPGKLWGARRG